MSHTSEQQGTVVDPCAEFGPDQRWAVVWFVLILIGGVTFVRVLSHIDEWMYAHNAEFLDYDAYADNRFSHTSIRSAPMDPRARGDLQTAYDRTGTQPK